MEFSTKFLNIAVIIFLMLTSLNASGQKGELYGRVTDSTSRALIGAYAVADGKTGVTTDTDGRFRFKINPGQHRLKFSYIGFQDVYKNINVPAGKSVEVNAILPLDVQKLNLVVVTASKYEKNIAEETVSMDIVSKDFIQNTNSRDVSEALEQSSGVQVQDGQISIRSGSSWSYGVGSRTALLQDGVSLQTADFGEAQLKYAPLETIDQIEIIKGASSVIYGSSALNGVVNLRTIWPTKNDQYTDIIPYYGFFGKPPRPELKWWEGILGRQPNFYGIMISHYRGGGSYDREKAKGLSMIAGFNMDAVQSFLQESDEFRIRGNFKTRYTLPKNDKINFGLNMNTQYENAGRFFLAEDLDSNAYRVAQGAVEKYVRTSVDPHFTFQSDKGHRYSFNSRYLNVWRKGNGEDINSKSHGFNMENQYQYNWVNKVIFTTGLPLNFSFSRSNLYSGVRVTVGGATFGQLEYKHDKFSLVGGLRYEISKVDEFTEKSIPVFRSGINVSPGKKGSYIRASWGQAYRLPTVGERFITGDIFEGFYLIPNPDLVAEQGWSSEVGFKQALKFKDKWKGFFDFAMFWNEYEEYVEYVPGFYENINSEGGILYPEADSLVFGLNPQNVDQARIFGYEVSFMGEGDLRPMFKLRTNIGYTYTYPGNLEDQEELANVGTFFKKAFSNHFKRLDQSNPDSEGLLFYRSRHVLQTQMEMVLYKKFTIGFSANYTSFPEKIPDLFLLASDILDEGEQTFLKFIDNHQKGDWLLFLRAFYEVKDYLRVGLFVKNLTNAETLDRPGKLRAPRNYTVQLKFSF